MARCVSWNDSSVAESSANERKASTIKLPRHRVVNGKSANIDPDSRDTLKRTHPLNLGMVAKSVTSSGRGGAGKSSLTNRVRGEAGTQTRWRMRRPARRFECGNSRGSCLFSRGHGDLLR